MSEESILDLGYANAEIDAPTGEYALSDARANFPALVNQAAEEGLRVVITRHGKPAAAIVPIRDLERLREADNSARGGLRIATSSEATTIDTDEDADAALQPTSQSVVEDLEKIVRAVLKIPGVLDRFNDLNNSQQLPSSGKNENGIQPRRILLEPSHI